MLRRLLTKNYKEVPLLFVNFNYQSFKKNGKKNSCVANLYPSLSGDEELKRRVNEIIDYIREKYDMEDII